MKIAKNLLSKTNLSTSNTTLDWGITEEGTNILCI